jgi:GH25 family lysozyme M1 (1,4-beta-N-acetylmuramidase)
MTALLIDVSSYQGSIDWTKVAKTRVGGIAKASEGTSIRDPYRTSNIRGMRAASMIAGAYHFARPTETGAAEQVTSYLDAIANLPVQFHALDLEDQDASRLGAHDIDLWAREWCRAVQAARPGERVVLYSFTSFIEDTMDGAPLTLAEFPLWIAAVGRSTAPGTISSHRWVLWQNTWTGYVEGVPTSNLDHDIWGGTEAEFRAWANGGTSDTTTVNPNPASMIVLEDDMLAYPPGHPGVVFVLGGGFKHRIYDPGALKHYIARYGAAVEMSISELDNYIDGPKFAKMSTQNTTRLTNILARVVKR